MRAATVAAALLRAAEPAVATCPASGAAVVVDTGQHRLWTCEDGRATGEYAVALGSGGVGKTRQGDAKVPLGEYALGAPRGSSSFHRFIPRRLPHLRAAAARVHGRRDIGVHGPSRGWDKMPASINTSTDWTLGCIAVGSDAEIDAIAAWVNGRRVRRIVVR